MMSGMQAPGRNVRIVYLAPKDVLVARVARKCMMQLCEGLTALGANVELISMRIRTLATEPTRARSLWDVYGIEHPFRVTMVPTPLRQERMDQRWSRFLILFFRLFVYPFYAWHAHLRRCADRSRPASTVFYSRNYGCVAGVLPLRKLLGRRAKVILELHVPPNGRFQSALLRSVDGVACQSRALQEVMLQKGLLTSSRSIGRHGGFSPYLTECARMTRAGARARLGWDLANHVACYTGKVVWGLGEIELLLRAAQHLAAADVTLVIVGGRADHVLLWKDEIARRGLKNVTFVGFVPPADAALYQMAADVLLLYYPSSSPLNDFRSPGKLFEYMASGTPAAVADYLSMREVIRDGENGLLVPPDRPDLLAQAVVKILDDPDLAGRLASQAMADAMLFTWTATARATLTLVDNLWSD
jgi:glycosyltransferase involved in cell wall biosynthesis